MSITLQKVEIEGHTVQLFQEEEGGHITGFRFSNGTYYPDPLSMLPKNFKPQRMSKTYEEQMQEVEDIGTYQSFDLPDRKIRKDVLDYYGVKVGVSEEDGVTPVTLHFPYTKDNQVCGFKTKLINPKRFWSVGNVQSNVDLFGWEQAMLSGSAKLFIVEGEMDALALWQMLKDKNKGTKWADRDPAVVSVPNGAGAAKRALMKKEREIFTKFKDVTLVFDMDDAGQNAAKDIIQVIPKILNAELPLKDAGECLMNGREKGCVNAVLFNASQPKNTRLVKGSQLREAARKKPEWGLSWPWAGMTDLTRGIRRGETIYLGAGVKMGKSELVNALAEHLIVHHDTPVLLVKPEEAMAKTYQMLVSKAAGKIFHDPKVEFDEEAFDTYEPKIGDKAIIVDNYQFVDWDTLKGDIKYAVINEGVKDVIIDPITALTNQMGTSEANEFLVAMAAELSAMAKDLDFTAYIFCHLKAPTQGEPHERGGHVLSTQFAGSRAMMRSCNYMIGMEGNKDPELDKAERNIRRLVLLEDREFGNTGIVPLYWDEHTALFNEMGH